MKLSYLYASVLTSVEDGPAIIAGLVEFASFVEESARLILDKTDVDEAFLIVSKYATGSRMRATMLALNYYRSRYEHLGRVSAARAEVYSNAGRTIEDEAVRFKKGVGWLWKLHNLCFELKAVSTDVFNQYMMNLQLAVSPHLIDSELLALIRAYVAAGNKVSNLSVRTDLGEIWIEIDGKRWIFQIGAVIKSPEDA